jgi:hypothetical protein
VSKNPTVREKVIKPGEARKYRRMDIAAGEYGISVALIKKLINLGRLRRFKLGQATLIDCRELEQLIVADIGNHGPSAAPIGARK